MKKPIVPGLYCFTNYNHVDHPQMAGSQLTLTWKQIEPVHRQFDWNRIDGWVSIEKAKGHKWVWRMDVHQNRGAISWPGWAPVHALKMADGNQVLVPAYESEAWQRRMIEAIRAVGARYDSDPDLTMVQIALGLYGETQPERDDSEGNLMGQIYEAGLSGCDWILYCKAIIDAYVEAFPTTELVIMNAPSYPFGCIRHDLPGYPTEYARPVIDDYALERGVGAQNNSWDEWDNKWYTAEVVGSQGPYTVHGSVGPFVQADKMLSMERGSWLSPFNTMFQPEGHQSWWSYLNALSKGARVLFPPNLPRKVWTGDHYIEFNSGIFDYPDDAPYADLLEWMNQFAIDVLAGKTKFWAAFGTPPDTPWRQTSQTWDHGVGVQCLGEMGAAWDTRNAKPPFYESKYMRALSGPVDFEIDEPGEYEVVVAHRGALEVLDHQYLPSDSWVWHSFTADVPKVFSANGTGHLHCMIFERVGDTPEPPPEPPDPPIEPPADKHVYGPFPIGKYQLTLIVESK